MKYWFVTYRTLDGEHEYCESGVLSSETIKQAGKKAQKAKAIFDRPGWEEFCENESALEIPEYDYRVLKRFTCDIDSYFDEKGKLRI